MTYHKPIDLKKVSLVFPHKVCFEDFSAQIAYGDRIAVIGRNGMGKSLLLKALQKEANLIEGSIQVPSDVQFGYVPQLPETADQLSGGEHFQKNLTRALALRPNVFLLDEPTNHLDVKNRRSLLQMLQRYKGTLIAVSHDVELLRTCTTKFWHVDHAKIKVFSGTYDDYIREIKQQRTSIEKEIGMLHQEKRSMHKSLMKEQSRAKKSRLYGEKKVAQGSWATIMATAKKNQAETTTASRKKEIKEKKHALMEELADLRLLQVVTPKFSLTSKEIGQRNIVSIIEGSIGYREVLIRNIPIYLSTPMSAS